ncbi:MAG TPA: hypothetical protein VK783_10945 [Bacteroidia bacterium]|jgi:hypothetical protein|nr:hypothetical protein [Bacteroidia bacterium]
MKNRTPLPTVTPEKKAFQPKKPLQPKPDNTIKNVLFKGKAFDFRVSTLESKEETFNKQISFSNPDKNETYLYIHRFLWRADTQLINAAISISVSSKDGKAKTIYQSNNISQSASKGMRKVNMSYVIPEGAEIKVAFECMGYDARHPKYSLEYKWLDPSSGKRPKVEKK